MLDASDHDSGAAKGPKPSISRAMHLMTRWSCSTMLVRDFNGRIVEGAKAPRSVRAPVPLQL